ncbi:hypothetical protein G8759_25210 [Spirosoma aureum]|uniref:Uncharacterized protein n=1 Tax=Spirosoma aureum TaxID=2692134 RepID=A0A6G9ATP1_9BACT|nr:hypothetical protein [Spirosoma aureum]QIP15696.1 hypothetical protein G8759_25210 [Spirosoma aureum]
MNTFELYISTQRGAGFRLPFTGPSSWDEVSVKQAVAIMRWRAVANSQPATQFAVLQMLYQMKPKQQRWLFDERFLRQQGLDDDDRATFLEYGQSVIDLIRWAGETEPGADFLVKKFRRFDFRYGTPGVLLRRLWYRKQYFAPAEALGDCTFEEFICAEKAYRTDKLAELATVLYRPQRQGEREAFSSKTLAERTALFADLDPALLQLIASQFDASLQYLQSCFRYVFPKKQVIEGAEVPKTNKPAGNWLDVAINMAKLDATKVGLIEQLNLYLALKVLNEQMRQADELEKQLEKAKNKSR